MMLLALVLISPSGRPLRGQSSKQSDSDARRSAETPGCPDQSEEVSTQPIGPGSIGDSSRAEDGIRFSTLTMEGWWFGLYGVPRSPGVRFRPPSFHLAHP